MIESVIYNLPSWANGRTGDAATLAAEANTDTAITPMGYSAFFTAIIGAAAEADRRAVADDLRPLMKEVKTMELIENAIEAGDLAGLNQILYLVQSDFAPATLAVLGAVIQAISLTAGAKNWNEDDGEMPDPFTAEWVTATLVQAGYVWNGTQWVRS